MRYSNIIVHVNTNTHIYPTWANHSVHLEFIPNHEYAKMCIRYQVPNIVNNTVINIIEQIHSLKAFEGYIQLITLQLYHENCHLGNCYICSRLWW